jgi:urease accessory protein
MGLSLSSLGEFRNFCVPLVHSAPRKTWTLTQRKYATPALRARFLAQSLVGPQPELQAREVAAAATTEVRSPERNGVRPVPLVLFLLLLLTPSAASAHAGFAGGGFMQGLAHPLAGLDHVLAMVAAGVFAARLGRRAVWSVPSAFLGAMALGGAAAMSGMALPCVETGIALSIVALGLAIAFELKISIPAAMLLVGCLAVFHGHAHGAEMPANAMGFAYGLGFVGATALLHALGVALGFANRSIARGDGDRLARVGGAAMTAAGLAFLSSSL